MTDALVRQALWAASIVSLPCAAALCIWWAWQLWRHDPPVVGDLWPLAALSALPLLIGTSLVWRFRDSIRAAQ